MKTYITFGQDHVHIIDGKTFDKDCIAIIESSSHDTARTLAFKFFGDRFCFSYPEDEFDHSMMKYFPKGFIEVT